MFKTFIITMLLTLASLALAQQVRENIKVKDTAPTNVIEVPQVVKAVQTKTRAPASKAK
jgi:hypothetical protein